MNALICKQILALSRNRKINTAFIGHIQCQCLSLFYLKMAAYQCSLSCLAKFGGAFGQTHLGQGQRPRRRWEI